MVPQPEALTTTASSPSPSTSRIQAATLALTASSVGSVLPKWWVRAPQHPAPAATMTSQPWRVRSRTVASLMAGSRTCCTQPVSRATRIHLGPSAAITWGRSTGDGRTDRRGARRSIPFRRPGISAAKGRARRDPMRARRNSPGLGNTAARMPRNNRSGKGRRYVFSMVPRAWSTKCMKSTLARHSAVQALHERQRSIWATVAESGGRSPCSMSRMSRLRPRGLSFSSLRTR